MGVDRVTYHTLLQQINGCQNLKPEEKKNVSIYLETANNDKNHSVVSNNEMKNFINMLKNAYQDGYKKILNFIGISDFEETGRDQSQEQSAASVEASVVEKASAHESPEKISNETDKKDAEVGPGLSKEEVRKIYNDYKSLMDNITSNKKMENGKKDQMRQKYIQSIQGELTKALGDPGRPALSLTGRIEADGFVIIAAARQDFNTGQWYWDILSIRDDNQ